MPPTGLWAVGRGREAPIAQQKGGVKKPGPLLPALGLPEVCPLPPGNHVFRAPASPASPTPGASPPHEAIMGPVLSTWSPFSSSQASLRCLSPPVSPHPACTAHTEVLWGPPCSPLPLQSSGLAGLDQSSWPAGGWALELSPRRWGPTPGHPHWSLLRPHRFPDPGLCTGHQAPSHTRARPISFSSEGSGQCALGAPLPGATHSGSHILWT